MEETNEKTWTEEELFNIRWNIIADVWILRHEYNVTAEQYEHAMNGPSMTAMNGQGILLMFQITGHISEYNTIANIPKKLPKGSYLLKMVSPWTEEDLQVKYNADEYEYKEVLLEEEKKQESKLRKFLPPWMKKRKNN